MFGGPNLPGIMSQFPPELMSAFSGMNTLDLLSAMNSSNPQIQDLISQIRDVAKATIPGKIVIEDINVTCSIDPNGAHLITIKEKTNLEKYHYWLVKDYDWNFDTLLKIAAIVLIVLSWGIGYVAAAAASAISDCMSPPRFKIELL